MSLPQGSHKPPVEDLSESWRSAATSGKSPLSINVKASEGRWSVDGQVLRWWYPVPTEGEQTYTITISRAGGAIKTAKTMGLLDTLRNCCVVM